MQGIYRILNLVNEMWYVGSASSIGKRWDQHRRHLRKGCDSRDLQIAFNEFGAENFVLEILEEVKGSRGDVYGREQEYLDEWFSTGRLYNRSPFPRGRETGWHHTEESKGKMRAAKVDYIPWNAGIQYSQERKANLGGCVTQEWRDNHDPPMLGKHHTEGTKKRLSEVNTGKRRTKETREKIGEASKGNDYGSKPYPAFYNVKTYEYISTGENLAKMCRSRGLSYDRMLSLKLGYTKRTWSGWRLVDG